MEIKAISFGKTSITLSCVVRNLISRLKIITIDQITMVNLNEHGQPHAHGKSQIQNIGDRFIDDSDVAK